LTKYYLLQEITEQTGAKMIVKQLQTSGGVIFFHAEMAKKYNLVDYYNNNKPALFMGCYNKSDMNNIINHKGFVLLLWLGTDAMRITSDRAKLLNRHNIHHIAQSEYIARDLKRAGLKYKRLNIAITNHKPNPQPLGEYVYFYYGRNNPEFYGLSRVAKIKEKYKDLIFVFGTIGTFPIKQMPTIYKQSFIGLRLTPHDGLPETVLEMGMMGRKCVWNGDFPGCYQWKTDQDIIDAIYAERENIGKTNHKLVKDIENYMVQGNNWLKTEYYGKKK